ncbi:hypothetical protein ACTZWW_21010 [Salinarimonas sp. NSM]|uniref:hypothetical protein n=1 Tax=Salinarimonas sp. NSM TaxID=3458003 RepID=UPI00403714AA
MTTDTSTIAVLLSPKTTLVVDIFRSLGDFEAAYDVGAIDVLEYRLTSATDGQTARAVVSDALLLGFALRNQRTAAPTPQPAWAMNTIGSRRASPDECAVLGLVAASKAGESALASVCARRLAVALDKTVSSLARDMGLRLEGAGMRIESRDWAPLLDARPAPPSGGETGGHRSAARS